MSPCNPVATADALDCITLPPPTRRQPCPTLLNLQAVMLEFFPQLLSLAQQLLRHAAEAVQAAGAQLYCLLFKHFTAAYNQQEVGQIAA